MPAAPGQVSGGLPPPSREPPLRILWLFGLGKMPVLGEKTHSPPASGSL